MGRHSGAISAKNECVLEKRPVGKWPVFRPCKKYEVLSSPSWSESTRKTYGKLLPKSHRTKFSTFLRTVKNTGHKSSLAPKKEEAAAFFKCEDLISSHGTALSLFLVSYSNVGLTCGIHIGKTGLKGFKRDSKESEILSCDSKGSLLKRASKEMQTKIRRYCKSLSRYSVEARRLSRDYKAQ